VADDEGKSPLVRWKLVRLEGKGELSEFSQRQVFFDKVQWLFGIFHLPHENHHEQKRISTNTKETTHIF
jgi:hypothetical protein